MRENELVAELVEETRKSRILEEDLKNFEDFLNKLREL